VTFCTIILLASGKIDAVIETDINISGYRRGVAIIREGRRPLHGIERRTDYAQIEHRVASKRTMHHPVLAALG